MRVLYVDNYRGFSNTFIPIGDVNFLVGENSTGKTSILSLIQLLSDSEFWFRNEFNTTEVELGNFSDIVSARSSDKTYFRIGWLEYDPVDEFPSPKNVASLMVFQEGNGLPDLKTYSYLFADQQIKIITTNRQVRYQHKPVVFSDDMSNESILLSIFKDWIEKHNENTEGFNIVQGFSKQELPFFFWRDIVNRLVQKKLNDSPGKPYEAQGLVRPPFLLSDPVWIAPVRSKSQRIYSGYKRAFSPEGSHTPHLVRELMRRKIKQEESFAHFINRFGTISGMYDRLFVKNYERSKTSPFELRVEIDGSSLRISDVGYGVSQSLPILAEVFARQGGEWFLLQQPEVHLHPKAQAAMGNIFLDLAVDEKKGFLIETHSDFMIDRYRRCYAKREEAHSIDSQVLFFEREKDGSNRVHPIPIMEDGSYPEDQPDSFRRFFIDEELAILGL